jgi:hypothetical protein
MFSMRYKKEMLNELRFHPKHIERLLNDEKMDLSFLVIEKNNFLILN